MRRTGSEKETLEDGAFKSSDIEVGVQDIEVGMRRHCVLPTKDNPKGNSTDVVQD